MSKAESEMNGLVGTEPRHPGFDWPADTSLDNAHVCVWQCKRCKQTTPHEYRRLGLHEIWMREHGRQGWRRPA